MSSGDSRPGGGLVPALLAALALRRSGLVRHLPAAEDGPGRTGRGGDEGRGPETEDVDVRKTALVMAGLAVAAATVVGGMVVTKSRLAALQKAALPSLTAQQTRALVPPPPNLQPDPYADLGRQRAEAEASLAGYAYLDPERTRARIPIDRAMDLIVGRPLDAPER